MNQNNDCCNNNGCNPPRGYWECCNDDNKLSAKGVKALYESNPDTNAFTTALKGKLLACYCKKPVGGVKSVVAGEHITVDNTDSANPIVSCSVAVQDTHSVDLTKIPVTRGGGIKADVRINPVHNNMLSVGVNGLLVRPQVMPEEFPGGFRQVGLKINGVNTVDGSAIAPTIGAGGSKHWELWTGTTLFTVADFPALSKHLEYSITVWSTINMVAIQQPNGKGTNGGQVESTVYVNGNEHGGVFENEFVYNDNDEYGSYTFMMHEEKLVHNGGDIEVKIDFSTFIRAAATLYPTWNIDATQCLVNLDFKKIII